MSERTKLKKQNNKYSKRKKRNIVVSLNCGKTTSGCAKIKHSTTARRHPRTTKTKNNKLRKLKSKYNKLFRCSKKTKEKENKDKEYFCDKYPDFDKFLSNYALKKVGNKLETKSTTLNKKELKEKARQNRGGLLRNY